jgi:hypothetical protein
VEDDTHVFSAYEPKGDLTIRHRLKYMSLTPKRSIFLSFQMSGILRACRIIRSGQADLIDVYSVIEIVRINLGNTADERGIFEWLKEAAEVLVRSKSTDFGINKYNVFVALEAVVHSRLAHHFLASLEENASVDVAADLLAVTVSTFSSIVSYFYNLLKKLEVYPKCSNGGVVGNTTDGNTISNVPLTVERIYSSVCTVRNEIIAAIAYVRKVQIYIEGL